MNSSILLLGTCDQSMEKLALKFAKSRSIFGKNLLAEVVRFNETDLQLKTPLNIKNEKIRLYISFEVARVSGKPLIVLGLDEFFKDNIDEIRRLLNIAKDQNIKLIACAQHIEIKYVDLFDSIFMCKTDRESDLFFNKRRTLPHYKFIKMRFKEKQFKLPKMTDL